MGIPHVGKAVNVADEHGRYMLGYDNTGQLVVLVWGFDSWRNPLPSEYDQVVRKYKNLLDVKVLLSS